MTRQNRIVTWLGSFVLAAFVSSACFGPEAVAQASNGDADDRVSASAPARSGSNAPVQSLPTLWPTKATRQSPKPVLIARIRTR